MRPDDPKLALLRARNAYNQMIERNIQSLREDARFQAQTGSPVRGYLTDLGTTALDLAGSVPSGLLSLGALGEYAARQYGRGVTEGNMAVVLPDKNCCRHPHMVWAEM
jgi:hypothetical protein